MSQPSNSNASHSLLLALKKYLVKLDALTLGAHSPVLRGRPHPTEDRTHPHVLRLLCNIINIVHGFTLTQLGTAYRLNTGISLLVDQCLAWALAAVNVTKGNTTDEYVGRGASLLTG